MTQFTVHHPTFFDVLCEHDPPGKQAGDVIEGVLRVRCWVRKINASDPEEAAQKAERFLTEKRRVRSIRVKKWRFSRAPQQGATY